MYLLFLWLVVTIFISWKLALVALPFLFLFKPKNSKPLNTSGGVKQAMAEKHPGKRTRGRPIPMSGRKQWF